jgi:hypothetical protein
MLPVTSPTAISELLSQLCSVLHTEEFRDRHRRSVKGNRGHIPINRWRLGWRAMSLSYVLRQAFLGR